MSSFHLSILLFIHTDKIHNGSFFHFLDVQKNDKTKNLIKLITIFSKNTEHKLEYKRNFKRNPR